MRRLLLLATAALLAGCGESSPVQPTDVKPTTDVAFGNKNGINWRVYNILPGTSKLWDIDQLQPLTDGIGQFPFQTFKDTTSGSFAVYLLANFNGDLTGKTITANVGVSAPAGTKFFTRSSNCANTGEDAYVRLEFQDVTAGPYDSNDYWWSTDNVALSSLSGTGTDLVAATTETGRVHWTNQAGRSATDTTHNWTDWTGLPVAASPYEGFTKALKTAKQLGLSFGSSCRYASGAAVTASGAVTFDLFDFSVAQ